MANNTITWRNTSYQESSDSPHEGYKMDESGVRRTIRLNDGIRFRRQAAVDFLGFSQVNTAVNSQGVQQVFINRLIPHAYHSPTLLAAPADEGGLVPKTTRNMWAVAIEDTTPMGIPRPDAGVGPKNADTINAGDTVEVDLQYLGYKFVVVDDSLVRALPPPTTGVPAVVVPGLDNPLFDTVVANRKPDEGSLIANLGWRKSRYILRARRPGARKYKAERGWFSYASPNQAAPFYTATREPITLHESMIDITYTWHQVPVDGVPNTAQANALGTLNAVSFDGYSAATLQLLGIGEEYHLDPLGNLIATIQYHMRFVSRIRRFTNLPPDAAPNKNKYLVDSQLGWWAAPRRYSPSPAIGLVVDWDILTSDPTGLTDNAKYSHRTTDFGRLFRPDQAYTAVFVS